MLDSVINLSQAAPGSPVDSSHIWSGPALLVNEPLTSPDSTQGSLTYPPKWPLGQIRMLLLRRGATRRERRVPPCCVIDIAPAASGHRYLLIPSWNTEGRKDPLNGLSR